MPTHIGVMNVKVEVGRHYFCCSEFQGLISQDFGLLLARRRCNCLMVKEWGEIYIDLHLELQRGQIPYFCGGKLGSTKAFIYLTRYGVFSFCQIVLSASSLMVYIEASIFTLASISIDRV
jgi:hypothetical protein